MLKMYTANKIVDKDFLAKESASLQSKGEKVVFTNGCFDIVHLGHIDYLEKAKSKGDILIVGLNSDASVKNIKGEDRPIIDQQSRGRLIAALSFVNYVVYFDEETPYELIKAIKPNVLIKGDDYNISNIVGSDIVMSNGGKVETVTLVKGYSTSNIIDKIKALNS